MYNDCPRVISKFTEEKERERDCRIYVKVKKKLILHLIKGRVTEP